MDLFKEIIFGSDDAKEANLISKAEKNGKIRKITSRLYTTNLIDSFENIVKRNLIDILAWRLPGAIISHRSAATLKPTEKGNIYLITFPLLLISFFGFSNLIKNIYGFFGNVGIIFIFYIIIPILD